MKSFDSLDKIYTVLNQADFEEDDDFSWEPIRPESFEVPKFQIIESNAPGASKKLKNKLSYILSFIDSIKHIRFSDGCTLMPIPIYSSRNIDIWGSPRNVSNATKYMISIGLITQETKANRFKHLGNTYKYYKENEDKFKEYCNERGIERGRYIRNISICESCKIDSNRVRFKSKVYFKKPKDLSEQQFEDTLTSCLYQNYPLFEKWKNIVENDINKRFYKDYPELQLRFRPHYKWSKSRKSIIGIGIRLTSSLNNSPQEERKATLEKYGFKAYPLCDIKSSVPRITYSLNKGHWFASNKIDFYELIYNELGLEEPFDLHKRDVIKKLHMRCYFEPSNKSLGHHTYRKIKEKKSENITEPEVYSSMGELRDAILQVEGILYDNEIFYIESLTYLMTLHDLLSYGYNVWLLYDSFYTTPIEIVETGVVTFEKLLNDLISANFDELYYDYFKKDLHPELKMLDSKLVKLHPATIYFRKKHL